MTNPFIHHVSVINRNRTVAFEFYHKLLGLDFLLKTVNQDDIDMIHIFFGDTEGRPGTEYSVFEMQQTITKTFGTNALERTVFAVPSIEALSFWEQRLEDANVEHCGIEEYNGSSILRFEDEDGVQLGLMPVPKQSNEVYLNYDAPDIPNEFAIYGIHSFHSRVRFAEASAKSITEIFDAIEVESFEDQGHKIVVLKPNYPVCFDQQLHFIEDRERPQSVEGVGSVQHIAINARDEQELLQIEQRLLKKNYHYSGIKDREFFKSLYYREPNRLLIEVATEQTNFKKKTYNTDNLEDIPMELPEFLEPRRGFIESKFK